MSARREVAALVVLAAVALGGCGREASSGNSGSEYVSGQSVVSEIAPDDRAALTPVSGALLDGGRFDAGDSSGSVVVFNVWGSWCAPCRAEAPALQAVWEELQPRGVQFIGVNVRDNDAAARAFEANYGVTYPSIATADSDEVLLSFRDNLPPSAVPSTLIVDRQGRVAVRIVGASTYTELRRLVLQTLDEPA